MLENRNYVPTLAIRPSEMNGLEYLPGETKDRMMPCILLAPWVSSASLDKAIERIEKAFSNRNYFLDIDRNYQFTNSESDAQIYFEKLMISDNAYSNWIDFVAKHERVWPCVQLQNQSKEDIEKQIEAIQKLGRPYCMRIVKDQSPNNIKDIVAAFSAGGSADFAIILEGGWTDDPLSLYIWFNGLITKTLQEIGANVPIIVSCTSFPKAFLTFNGITKIPFENRRLVEQIRPNRMSVVYGDWGSTRPREPSFGRRPFDRIDLPADDAWYIVRNKDEDWDFGEAAKQLVSDDDIWDENYNVWGKEQIRLTTINKEIGINSPQQNVAVRVNIHLHRQAFYGQTDSDVNADSDATKFDEAWED